MKQAAVPMLWTDVAFLLRDCPDLDLGDLRTNLLTGKQQLWVAVDNPHRAINAVILTEKHKYPPLKRPRRAGRPRHDDFPDRWNLPERHVLVIHLAGRHNDPVAGSVAGWIDAAVEAIEAFARELNCTELRILCRKGWRPYARRFGKGFDRVTFRRDRLTLPQFRRQARKLEAQWQSGSRTGLSL